MTESFNAGDTVFYKTSTDHYLQCRIVQVVGGETGVHIALLGSTRRTFKRAFAKILLFCVGSWSNWGLRNPPAV